MKHLNIFSSIEEYENNKSGELLNRPNISLVDEDNTTRYLPIPAESTYVDLGLPSGLKWAAGNLGADKETDPGLYFAWGETTGYTSKQVTDGVRGFNKTVYNSGPAASISSNLTLEQDAANVYLGGNWRMPTSIEFNELLKNTNITWTTINGVSGYKFTNKTDDSKYIFMPAAGMCQNSLSSFGSFGFYWTSSFNSSSTSVGLNFNSSDKITGLYDRYVGRSVRGVYDSSIINTPDIPDIPDTPDTPNTPDLPEITEDELPEGYVDLGLPSGLKWSSCNIGASSPCEYGKFFQWGRIDGYSPNAFWNFYFGEGNPPTKSGKNYSGGEVLIPKDDAAYFATNGKLRMPTKAEIEELLANTNNEWCQCTLFGDNHANHNVYGRLFTSKKDTSKKIFIPAAGFSVDGGYDNEGSIGGLWSSTADFNYSDMAYKLYFTSGSCTCDNYNYGRKCGFSVRGVCK